MAQVNDDIFANTGQVQINDGQLATWANLNQYNDAKLAFSGESGAMQDAWFAFLGGLGYTGALSDRWAAYWAAGGGGGGGLVSVPITDGATLGLDITPTSGALTIGGAAGDKVIDTDKDTAVIGNWSGRYSYGFDLGSPTEIQTIIVYTRHGSATLFHEFWISSQDIEVYSSDDNVTYALVKTFNRPPIYNPAANRFDFTLQLDSPVTARYFKVRNPSTSNLAVYQGSQIIQLTEMEAYTGTVAVPAAPSQGTALTYRQGYTVSGDTTPLSGAMTIQPKSADGDILTTVYTTWSPNYSLGVELLWPTHQTESLIVRAVSSNGLQYSGYWTSSETLDAYYSNDNSTWTLIQSWTTPPIIDNTTPPGRFDMQLTFAAPIAARYFKVRNNTGNNFAVTGGVALVRPTEVQAISAG